MIWLASFPRSGNTFFRNILDRVYGLESSSFHLEDYQVQSGVFDFPFVKTHLLPGQLPEAYKNVPSVYIVRDGRDAITSMAYHRKNFIARDSNILQSITEGIIASEGSFFGGWSQHVSNWCRAADIIIKFEDLITDPINEVEKIRRIFPELPQPRLDQVPTFEVQKSGKAKYGTTYDPFDSAQDREAYAQNFFRSGQSQQWQKEMPKTLQIMYWGLHASVSEKIGYDKDGQLRKWSQDSFKHSNHSGKSILLECKKLEDSFIDGTKRYVQSLLKGLKQWDAVWGLPFEFYVKTSSIRNFKDERPGSPKSVSIISRVARFLQNLIGQRAYVTFILALEAAGIKSVLRRVIENPFEKQSAISQPFDLIHYTTPEIHNDIKVRSLCTLHDVSFLAFPQFHKKENIRYHKVALNNLIKHKSNFLTVSNYTKQEFDVYYHGQIARATTVYESIDHERFYPVLYGEGRKNVLDRYQLSEGNYFLSLSTIEPRKNITKALEAFALFKEQNPESTQKFVLAGRYGWKVNGLPLGNDVIKTGYLDEKDINVIMGSAIGLCYLSFYEGFGLPPLEAMRCKTVPIYGANSSMIELIGDCGIPVDPTDVNSIYKKMEALAYDQDLREELEEKAYLKSWEYTMEKMIDGNLQYYRQLIID